MMSDGEQFRFDSAELGTRVAAGLLVENLAMRPYNPPERHLRKWPAAADPEEVSWSILTLTWRRHGVGFEPQELAGGRFGSAVVTTRFRFPGRATG